MPRVPGYEEQQAALKPLPGVRESSVVTPSFLSLGHARTEQTGQQITQAGGQLAQVAVRAQEELNGNRIFEAETALDGEMIRLNEWITEHRGQRAWGLTGRVERALDDIQTKTLSTLENEPQRQTVGRKLAKARSAAMERVTAWEIQQREISTKNVAVAAIKSSQDRAISAVGSPSEKLEIDNASSVIRQNLDWLQEVYGLSPEEAEVQSKTESSRLHLGVIQRKLLAGDATGARDYFEGSKMEILGDLYDDVEAKLKGSETQLKARDAADAAIALGDGNLAIATDEIRKAKLDPDVEKAALGRIREIDADNDELKREQQKDHNNAAWQSFFDGGSRMSAVPAMLLHNADPATRLAMQHEADRILAQKKGDSAATVKTDPNLYYQLRKLIHDDPKAFRATDLRKYFAQLSPNDREEFIKLQTAPDEKVKDVISLYRQLVIAHGIMGLTDGDIEQKAIFDQAVVQAANNATHDKGSPLDLNERQRIIDRMMIPGAVPGFLFDKRRRYYQVIGTEDERRFKLEYSDYDVQRMTKAFQDQGVRAPTRSQIEEAIRFMYGLPR
ncbi:MAG: hypothetical protein KIT73_10255 [Burkholderiales bacterium]|nr:hypothetical protein [Burkholderiales bacterium]